MKPRPRRFVITAAEPTVETQSKPSVGTSLPPVKRTQESGTPPPPPPPPSRRLRPERSWFSIAAGQALDSVSDVLRHGRRSLLPLPTERSSLDRLVPGDDGQLRLQVPKPVILVLGSGWGAHSLIKVVDTDTFDVVVVSPRNHFVFTPMLPSCAVGTVEFRSVLEPIRVSNPFVTYFEATVDSLDLTQRVATCTSSIAYVDGRRPTFKVPYDVVVVSVGEQPATLGVPGVEEHAYFMKEVMDTVRLRQRISECFELASLPGTTEEDRRSALRFVVVGGGPTGVEFAGTLGDFVRVDLKKRYPELMQYVSVQLLQSSQSILTQFDSKMQEVALESLAKGGVQVRTGVRVAGITKDEVTLSTGEAFGYGVCVWSAGNATRPLVSSLVQALPEQQALQRAGAPPTTHKLAVDPYLRVVGARGAFAMGDCCKIVDDPLPSTAQVAGQQGPYVAHLVNRGYALGVGGLDELPPHRPREALPEALLVLQALLTGGRPNAARALADKRERARNQVAPRAVGDGTVEVVSASGDVEVLEEAAPFEFLSLGIMAYVGADSAVQQIEAGSLQRNISGRFAYLLWRSVYITKQVSFRNRVLILFDWLKAQVFGRDISML